MVIINGSPRMNKNTATLLKEARRGAESIGAEVEYIAGAVDVVEKEWYRENQWPKDKQATFNLAIRMLQ